MRFKQLDHWQYQCFNIVLEIFPSAKQNCKNWIRKRGNCWSSMDSITQRQTHITGVFPENRGSGLTQLEDAHITEITKILEYTSSKVDPLIQIIRTHQQIINSTLLQTARWLNRELHRGTRQIKDSITEKTKERWQGKRMHGQFPSNLDKKLVDNEQSYQWQIWRH